MKLSPAALDATYQGFQAKYDDALDKVRVYSPRFVETVKSTTGEEVYAFLDKQPKLREWVGHRRYNNLVTQAYKLANKKFESSYSVKAEDIEDDKLAMYAKAPRRVAAATAKWPDQRVKLAMQNGKTNICFDGKPFFSAAHYKNYGRKSGAQANLFTNRALNYTNMQYVIQQMMSIVGADGEPMEDFGDNLVLIVAPDNRDIALQLQKGDLVVRTGGQAGGTSGADNVGGAVRNVHEGSFDVVVWPSLANEGTTWYVADTDGEMPLIMQERVAPEFRPLTDIYSPRAVELDEFGFGVRARGESGYGPWWKMARCEA